MSTNNRATYLLKESRRIVGSQIRALKKIAEGGEMLSPDQVDMLRGLTATLVAVVKSEGEALENEQAMLKSLTDDELAKMAAKGVHYPPKRIRLER